MDLEASIVERLTKLQKWQMEQQQRLLKQQKAQRELLTLEQGRMYEALALSVNDLDNDNNDNTSTKENDTHSLLGVNPLSPLPKDDGLIQSLNKDCETLVPTKLEENEGELPKTSIKRPFLKKGQGLARFRMQNSVKSISKAPSNIKENKKKHSFDTSSLDSKIEKELEEIRVFELMEKKAENSSFCSTSSAVVAFLQQSTPMKINKPKETKCIQGYCTMSNENSTYNNDLEILHVQGDRKNSHDNIDHGLSIRFAEYHEYQTYGLVDALSVSSESITTTRNNLTDGKAWSNCSSIDSSTNTEQIIIPEAQEIQANVNIENRVPSGTVEILKNRLLELEKEINIFRQENILMSSQREKLHQERQKLYQDLEKREIEFDNKKQEFENKLAEEKKKITSDKLALENRLKHAQEQAQKNKCERLKSQNLRVELEHLKQDYKEKESHWNAAQARHKSQLRILRVENNKLKEEIQQLNAKLDKKKKINPAGHSKIFAQINKQIQQIPKNQEEENKEEPPQSMENVIRRREFYKTLVQDATADLDLEKEQVTTVQHADGRIEYWYSNGNVKKVLPDERITKMIYHNGDVREIDSNGKIKYFYASNCTWHTTFPNGLEVLEFNE